MARRLPVPLSLSEIVGRFGGTLDVGDPAALISGVAPLPAAGPQDLAFLAHARFRDQATGTRAGVVIVSPMLAAALPLGVPRILADNPYAYYAGFARWFEVASAPLSDGGVHPQAIVAADAVLGEGVTVGPGCVIEEGARIDAGAMLGAGVFIGAGSRIGARTRLAPRVTVMHDCRIGCDGLVHSGTVIGSDGFGFAHEGERWMKIPQLGRVLIGDQVEIGAQCAIDRGALEDTEIGDGCKLDNLIQVAHNVRIGANCALAGCVGIAGSAVIGQRCMIGGGTGIAGHLEICDDVTIFAYSLVTRSIREPGVYSGSFPLMDSKEWEKAAVIVRRLADMRDRVRRLEKRFGDDAS